MIMWAVVGSGLGTLKLPNMAKARLLRSAGIFLIKLYNCERFLMMLIMHHPPLASARLPNLVLCFSFYFYCNISLVHLKTQFSRDKLVINRKNKPIDPWRL